MTQSTPVRTIALLAILTLPGLTIAASDRAGDLRPLEAKAAVALSRAYFTKGDMAAAVALARFSGARVLTTVRSDAQETVAMDAGAHEVIRTDGVAGDEVVSRVLEITPEGVDHIVEVAFHANIAVDEQVLRQGGSIATFATGDPSPALPFWPLVFKNSSIHFLGSDDFTAGQKAEAARDLSAALTGGWAGYSIGQRFPLEHIARAHMAVDARTVEGRVVLDLTGAAS